MAVSDLLFPLVLLPVEITQLVTGSGHWRVRGIIGSIFCKLSIFTNSVSLLVSAQSLVWIAIDRFVAVVFPVKLGLISSKIRIIAVASTWILAGVFYFPLLITWELVEHGNNAFCSLVNKQSIFPDKEAKDGYYWFHVTIRFIAPLLLVTILYSAIAVALKRQSKVLMDTSSNVAERRYLQKRKKATEMAVVILVLFYFCVFPYTVLHFSFLIFHWKHFCAFWKLFQCLSSLLFFLSSVVNPVLCLSFVEAYRRGLKNILCPCCRIQNNNVMARQEKVTLKGMKNLCEELNQQTSKESNISPRALDGILLHTFTPNN